VVGIGNFKGLSDVQKDDTGEMGDGTVCFFMDIGITRGIEMKSAIGLNPAYLKTV
jgi:hypothetical protein